MHCLWIYLNTFVSRIIRIRAFDNALLPKSSLAINGDNAEHKRKTSQISNKLCISITKLCALHLLVSEIYLPPPITMLAFNSLSIALNSNLLPSSLRSFSSVNVSRFSYLDKCPSLLVRWYANFENVKKNNGKKEFKFFNAL